MSFARRSLVLLTLLLAACADAPRAERDSLFLTRKHITPAGDIGHYVVFVPPNRDPATKLPVILFLNGWGENGNDGLRQISNNFGGDVWRMRDSFPFLAVCPQCSYNAEWTPGSKNASIALGALDEAIQEFNGDPDRVTVTGASTGGTGALNLAAAHPGRFAAIVPISTPIHLSPAVVAETGLPIWNFYNNRDSAGVVRAIRSCREDLLAAGVSPHVTEFIQQGHNAWDAAYASPALYRWMLQQNRRSQSNLLRFDLHAPAVLLATWKTENPDRWRSDGQDLVAAPGNEPVTLMSSAQAGDWELHLDLHMSVAQEALITLHGIANDPATLSLVLPDDGQIQLRTSASADTRPMAPIAQRALRPGWNDIRLARTGDRLSVTFNGWPAIETADPLRGDPTRFGITHPGGAAEQRWRDIRTSRRPAIEGRP